jgi:polyhydroxybutyrate depolymerase
MRKYFLFMLLLAFYNESAAQLLSDSFLIDGRYRSFHFNKPVTKSNASLVFVLHGSGGKGENMMKNTTRIEEKSAVENLILVYPDGYKNYWNECRKASTATANLENIDEGTFFNKMIGYFVTRYQVNARQVFAIGFSGGGHMAYKLALTMPDRFKGITAIVANLPDTSNMDCDASGKAVPVMIVNGTADPVNPYNGGEVMVTNVKLGTVRSTDETFAYWRKLDGCKKKPAKELLPDTNPSDGKTIEKYTCSKNGHPEVVLLKVINGKHEFPDDIDVYLTAWDFFKKQFN